MFTKPFIQQICTWTSDWKKYFVILLFHIWQKTSCHSFQVMIYNPVFFKYVHEAWLEGHGHYPSTGFLSLLLALHICDEVRPTKPLGPWRDLTLRSSTFFFKWVPVTWLYPCSPSAPGQRVWLRRRPVRELAPLLGGQPIGRSVPTHGDPRWGLRIQRHPAAGGQAKDQNV